MKIKSTIRHSNGKLPLMIAQLMICVGLTFLGCSEKPTKSPVSINHPPQTPQIMAPIDDSQNIATNVILSWQCIDPDGDSLTFNIFFGDHPADLSLADSGLMQLSFSPGWLEYQTTYFWMVRARDVHGDTASSPLWSFKTKGVNGIQLLGTVDIPSNPNNWFSLAVTGNYVFAAMPGSPLFVYDLADPARPFLLSQYGNGDSLISQIVIRNNVAYLAEALYGLEIVDISNPSSPFRIAGYHAPGLVNSIILRDNYAYLGSSAGITTLDISNPANPVPLDTSNYSAGVLEISGNYAYSIGGCGFEQECLSWFEIRDNISFEFINSINLEEFYVEGFDSDYRFLFVSYIYSPLEVYSLVSPSNPQLVYSFPLDSASNYYAPFVNGDLLYTSSMTNRVYGLKIFNIEDISNPTLVAELNTTAAIIKIVAANNYIYAIDAPLAHEARLLVFGYLP